MVDNPLQTQIDELIWIVLLNPYNAKILNSSPFPKGVSWYLGAGSICQSVWNYLSGKKPEDNIKDYDLVYYNADDLSKESEISEENRLREDFADLPVRLDVKNEARVHLWYHDKFGKVIEQLSSCEDAINSWPTTANSIGVNKVGDIYNVYAPYGLNDVFGMVLRPNKPSCIKAVYEKKVESWTSHWPRLKVVPWDV